MIRGDDVEEGCVGVHLEESAEQLMRHAEELAKADGADSVHVSTNHVGLYERYGYTFFGMMKDVGGEDSRVYVKHL